MRPRTFNCGVIQSLHFHKTKLKPLLTFQPEGENAWVIGENCSSAAGEEQVEIINREEYCCFNFIGNNLKRSSMLWSQALVKSNGCFPNKANPFMA